MNLTTKKNDTATYQIAQLPQDWPATHLTIVTPCRDAEAQLAQYIRQVLTLEWQPEAIRIIMVEGDSTDDTLSKLQAWAIWDNRVQIVKCDTGSPKYGSVVNADRFEVLAEVFNAGMDTIDTSWTDHVLMMPVDVKYRPSLAQSLAFWDKDMIAPMSFTTYGFFYDTWAFVKDGQNFVHHSRDWIERWLPPVPFEMDSVGGANMMKVDLVQLGVRYSPETVDKGLCAHAKSLGYRVWADPTSEVEHQF